MEPKEIPAGHSPVRSIMSDQHPHHPVGGFEDAKKDPDGVAIFEGDYGGQIMMTIRMKYVRCPEEWLRQLLVDLNDLYWDGYDGSGLYYESIPVGGGVAGGMCGGQVVDGVWAHSRLAEVVDLDALGQAVGAILECRAQRLPPEMLKKRRKK